MCIGTAVTPRVWIGCLTCYNEGRLVGDWYDAVEAAEVTTDDIHNGHVRPGTHEELWVLDHEGIPLDGEIDPATATAWAEALEQVGEDEREALCAWVRSGSYISEGTGNIPSISDFEEAYDGEWLDFREFAEHLAFEVDLFDACPDQVVRYFDWGSWTRDLRMDYTVEDAPGGSVFVYRNL